MNPRKIVLKALIDFFENMGYSNLTLDGILKEASLDNKDKAFVSNAFYGVIERKITLDYIISKLSTTKINKMSPLILNVLRLGLYQMIYMDKVPDNAAVNESVNLVKKSKFKNLSGFVNAVLRSYLRNPVKLPQGEDNRALSIIYSCPEWFIKELSEYLGKEECIKFLENSLLPPPIYARVNTLKTTEEDLLKAFEKNGIECEKTKLNNAIKIGRISAIAKLEDYKKGHFYIQDIASQIAVNTFSCKSGDRVLDICSAPGGKTFTTAQLMENTGEIISCDLHNHRVKLIADGAKRLGINIVKAMQNDATCINEKLGNFDKIICDVPCSGFGDIRRKPEIKYKDSSDLTNLPELQYNILNNSAKYLKKGGYILYSTCTLRKVENEDIVERFLNDHPDF